jgi:hypothetical protein
VIYNSGQSGQARETAQARGVERAIHMVERRERIVPEIEEARRAGAEALNVLPAPILYAWRLEVFEPTGALRLPAIYQSPEFAEEGGLSGYGPRITQMFRQLARQLAKIFSGEKVSDVPGLWSEHSRRRWACNWLRSISTRQARPSPRCLPSREDQRMA